VHVPKRVAAVLLFVVAACGGGQIRTTGEYRAALRSQRLAGTVTRLDVRLPYRKVLANLTAFSDRCLNAEVYEGSVRTGTPHQLVAEVAPAGESKGELSLTVDGAYWLVTDVEPASAGTRLTVYTQHKPYVEYVSGWAAGTSRKCPY
jgi:hypothetical protein